MKRERRIFELNVGDRLNALALECLQGVADADSGTLGVIELLRIHWEDLERSRLMKLSGAPSAEELWSVLEFLDRGDPDDAMRFLTTLGGARVVEVAKLEERDGYDIALELFNILMQNVTLGVSRDSFSSMDRKT